MIQMEDTRYEIHYYITYYEGMLDVLSLSLSLASRFGVEWKRQYKKKTRTIIVHILSIYFDY